MLRTSDILNSLMDIDGVIAVNQLQLTKYDSEGNPVKGAADPDLGHERQPHLRSEQSQRVVAPVHQPAGISRGST